MRLPNNREIAYFALGVVIVNGILLTSMTGSTICTDGPVPITWWDTLKVLVFFGSIWWLGVAWGERHRP